MNKAEITYISVDKLHPHENNPRKDIGDVSELAESIKAKGILQNLTVVPCTGHYYGDYTVIIGHRRLAAAKEAGLTEIPCIIAEMDEKEQLATMLLENMQRSDLTTYEQAQGIQMMLDLGETVESVAEKTGFSASTIYRRTRLLKLDADIFKSTEGRQINITEYDKLFEIEDDKRRNDVLKTIGTNNFNNTLQRAVYDEKAEKDRKEFLEFLQETAEEITNTVNKKYIGWADGVQRLNAIEVPEGAKLYYKKYSNTYYDIYRDFTDEEIKQEKEKKKADSEASAAQAKRERRTARLDDMSRRFYELRKEFVRNCVDLKKNHKGIFEFLLQNAIHEYGANFDDELFCELMGIEVPEDEDFDFDCFRKQFDEAPERMAFVAAYCMSDDGPRNKYHKFRGEYYGNSELDKTYEMLEKFGYEMSDEEKAYRDGTHELFAEETENEKV